jgi:hypothetical protein
MSPQVITSSGSDDTMSLAKPRTVLHNTGLQQRQALSWPRGASSEYATIAELMGEAPPRRGRCGLDG